MVPGFDEPGWRIAAIGSADARPGRGLSETAQDSPGARLIIEEARTSPETLFVACIGPLPDIASALLLERELIEGRVTVVWVGGAPYGDRLPVY